MLDFTQVRRTRKARLSIAVACALGLATAFSNPALAATNPDEISLTGSPPVWQGCTNVLDNDDPGVGYLVDAWTETGESAVHYFDASGEVCITVAWWGMGDPDGIGYYVTSSSELGYFEWG